MKNFYLKYVGLLISLFSKHFQDWKFSLLLKITNVIDKKINLSVKILY